MAPHSSALAWKSPWTEEPGRLQAVHGVAKSRTRLSNFTFTFHFHALEKEMATHSSVLDWRIPGMGEPGGLLSMGSQRVRHNWSNLAAAAADKEPAGPRASSTLFWGKDSGQSTKSISRQGTWSSPMSLSFPGKAALMWFYLKGATLHVSWANHLSCVCQLGWLPRVLHWETYKPSLESMDKKYPESYGCTF